MTNDIDMDGRRQGRTYTGTHMGRRFVATVFPKSYIASLEHKTRYVGAKKCSTRVTATRSTHTHCLLAWTVARRLWHVVDSLVDGDVGW